MAGRGGGCHIHDNIHSILLARGSNAKAASVQLGRGSRGRAGAEGGAVYTKTSVACGWAGAVMRKLHAKEKYYRPTDRPGDL